MKELIEKKLKKVLHDDGDALEVRTIIRDFETYATITESQQDSVLRTILENRNAELASLLKIPVVKYNWKFKNFTFSNQEIETIIRYLKR